MKKDFIEKIDLSLGLGITIGMAIIIAVLINTFLFDMTIVKGESMTPTLNSGDKLILNKLEKSLASYEYHRGDIVVFSSPIDKDKLLIKRVVALEGDLVRIEDGLVAINGRLLEENYIRDKAYTEQILMIQDYQVPDGELYVLGDNRNPKGSTDSRFFGGVPLENIRGKVIFRVSPLRDLRRF